ncbi:MAG: 16S rRNA (cytidine(1402)-2'-O)-methyltransferase [Anaerolineaceae bacterium]|nr:16S rRNA (cytidine(1402)-2'-O)-methyltransferase [Anaerolineaceae bacterium]
MPESGQLYIVATPIGHPDDITLRALEVLRSADAIICEETKEGSKLVKKLNLPHKELISLNEHNEQPQTQQIIQRLLEKQSFALVSDCGTPVFEDPGHHLIQEAAAVGIRIIPIPGPSSLVAALSILDFRLEQFVFGGFLPREATRRQKELLRLRSFRMPVVLMDTPYRLAVLLDDVSKIFGKNQTVTLACNLTLPGEAIFRGSVETVIKKAAQHKAEFVLIIHNNTALPY